MSKIASMGPASLEAAHRFVLELDLAARSNEIQDDAHALETAGKLDPQVIEAAIREHRERRPYR